MKTIKPATAGNYLSVTQEDGTKFICTEISTYDDASIEYEEITVSDKTTIEEQKKITLPNVVKDTLLQTVECINADKELQTKLTNIDSSIITTQTKLNYITEIVDNSVGWISQDVKTLFTGLDTSLYTALNEIFKNKELLTALQQAYTDGKLTEGSIGLTEVQDEILSYLEDSYTNSSNLNCTRDYLKLLFSDPCAGQCLYYLVNSKEPLFIQDPSQSVYNCIGDNIGTSIIEGIATRVSGGLNSSYSLILSTINSNPSIYAIFTNSSSLAPLAYLGEEMRRNSSLYKYIVGLNGTSSSSSGGLDPSTNDLLNKLVCYGYTTFTNPSLYQPLYRLVQSLRDYSPSASNNLSAIFRGEYYNGSINSILNAMRSSATTMTSDPCLYEVTATFVRDCSRNSSFRTLNTWLENNAIQDLYNKIDELNTKLNNLTSQ